MSGAPGLSTPPRAHTPITIGEQIGLTPGERVEDLIERVGVAEGMLIEEARTRWPTREYPGAEATEAVLMRALRAMDALAVAQAGENGAIVTRGTTLRLVVGHEVGKDPGILPHGVIAVLDGDRARGASPFTRSTLSTAREVQHHDN